MTAIDALGRVFDAAVKPPYLYLRRKLNWVLFERRYGVYTEAQVRADELGLPGPDLSGYMPYGWLSLRRILPRREVSPNDVFLDVGSGMGRVVLQAAMSYPFRRILGIELSTYLHEIAVANLAANKPRLRCQQVELQHGDALDIELPDDVTVVFLYNSFTGEAFQRFIDRLLRSVERSPRPVRLIYANPREEAWLLATGHFRLVRSLRGWRPTRAWSASNSTRMYDVLPPGRQQTERNDDGRRGGGCSDPSPGSTRSATSATPGPPALPSSAHRHAVGGAANSGRTMPPKTPSNTATAAQP